MVRRVPLKLASITDMGSGLRALRFGD